MVWEGRSREAPPYLVCGTEKARRRGLVLPDDAAAVPKYRSTSACYSVILGFLAHRRWFRFAIGLLEFLRIF